MITTPSRVSVLWNRVTIPVLISWSSASTSFVIREISTPGRLRVKKPIDIFCRWVEDPQPQVLERALADPADQVGLHVARPPVEQRRWR